jgi:RHS repeat-associated protein
LYDPVGRLLKVTDAIGVEVKYEYDNAGNKVYMTDGRGKVTRYSFGAFGWMNETTNAVGMSIRYQFDLAGNVTGMIDRIGNHTGYTYDSRNLLLNKSVKETGDSISYTYDEVGNRANMTDGSGASSYEYDKKNELLRISKDGVVQISYTYDAAGNIATVTDKTGIATTYTYDKVNRMETVLFKDRKTSYSYDENGNRKSIEYEGGVKEEYSFNKNNKLLSLRNQKPDGTTISSYDYTYDATGRQVSKTDNFGTTNYTYDAVGRIEKVEAPGKTTVYAYDRSGNRQTLNETYTSAQPSGYVEPNSKVEVKYQVKKSEYVYSNTNELLRLVEQMYDEAGTKLLEKTTSYLYDMNGNEIRQKVGYIHPHTRSMRQVTEGNLYGDDVPDELDLLIEKVNSIYDGFNQLKQVEKIKAGDRATVEYTYNGDGLRTRKVVRSWKDSYAEKVTNYLYDRQHVVLETDASEQMIVRYVRGINYIARVDGSDKFSYYLYNGHGDVVQTVSASGVIENQYDYDVFGNPTLTVEEYGNAIRFAGEFLDDETGLYYLRSRYYDPYTGRFTTEDTYAGREEDPLSLNRYTYVLNNPLTYLDPTGHWEEEAEDSTSSEEASTDEDDEAPKDLAEQGEDEEDDSDDSSDSEEPESKDAKEISDPEEDSAAKQDESEKDASKSSEAPMHADEVDPYVKNEQGKGGSVSEEDEKALMKDARESAEKYDYDAINKEHEKEPEVINLSTEQAHFVTTMTANYGPEKATEILEVLSRITRNEGEIAAYDLIDIGLAKEPEQWKGWAAEAQALKEDPKGYLAKRTEELLFFDAKEQAEMINAQYRLSMYDISIAEADRQMRDEGRQEALMLFAGSAAKSGSGGSRVVQVNGVTALQGGMVSKGTGNSLSKIDDFVDLTGHRKDHILNRHRAGAGKPDKTEFPSNWNDNRILHQVSDVASDPNAVRGIGKYDSPYAIGTRDGIEIRVDFYPNNHKSAGQISTAYPTNVPANPSK